MLNYNKNGNLIQNFVVQKTKRLTWFPNFNNFFTSFLSTTKNNKNTFNVIYKKQKIKENAVRISSVQYKQINELLHIFFFKQLLFYTHIKPMSDHQETLLRLLEMFNHAKKRCKLLGFFIECTLSKINKKYLNKCIFKRYKWQHRFFYGTRIF